MIEAGEAERERQIVETFVELSASAGGAVDVVDVLRRLVARSVQLLDCADAGLLVHDGAGVLHVMTAGRHPAALEMLQGQRDAGASLAWLDDGPTVFSEDRASDAERWPAFARVALAQGFRSVQALPISVAGETLGALILFRGDADRITDRDDAVAHAMAEIVAAALGRERVLRRADGTIEQLQRALTSRVVIEQAKGVLAARTGLGVEAAFDHLRTHARHQNRRLVDVARLVVDGGRGAEALISAAAPRR